MQQPLSLSETGSLVAVVWTGTKRLIWHRQQIGGRPSGILILAPEPRREPSTTEAGTDWIVGLPGKAAGESELIRHSLLGLVSLRPALPALYDLFPALQEIGRFTTPTIAPDDLGRRIAGLAQPVLLIVDTPGAERDVLEAFEAAQGLERIGIIRLRCGAEPFFEGAWSCEEALAWLSARHFRVIARNDVDPEWPEITLEVDFQGRRIASLEDAFAQRDAALTETRKGLAGLQAEVAGRTARLTEVEAALAQRDATLTETRKGLDDCKADLSVTLRMQMLTQADLRDLQERYREADRQRQAQADLLQKLAPRLQMVRHQLTQVMDPPPLELPNGRIIISTSHKKKKRNAGSKAERKS